MKKERVTTKQRALMFLAMNCNGYLQEREAGNKEHRDRYLDRIHLLCEVLKIDSSRLNHYKMVKDYYPDVFAQPFCDNVRKYVK